ncbi:unnamed protein product [Absidia cylindrospora]
MMDPDNFIWKNGDYFTDDEFWTIPGKLDKFMDTDSGKEALRLAMNITFCNDEHGCLWSQCPTINSAKTGVCDFGPMSESDILVRPWGPVLIDVHIGEKASMASTSNRKKTTTDEKPPLFVKIKVWLAPWSMGFLSMYRHGSWDSGAGIEAC